LEEVGFFFSKKPKCHPRNFFGDDAFVHVNKQADANVWLKLQNEKSIQIFNIQEFNSTTK